MESILDKEFATSELPSSLQLRQHGLALNDEVLDDSRRTLVRRRPQVRNRSAVTLRRLDEVLDDLDRALALHEGRSSSSRTGR